MAKSIETGETGTREEVRRLIREADGLAKHIARLLDRLVRSGKDKGVSHLHLAREANVLKAITESMLLGVVDWLDEEEQEPDQ